MKRYRTILFLILIISFLVIISGICFKSKRANTSLAEINKVNSIFIPNHGIFEENPPKVTSAIIPTFTFHAIGDDFRGSKLTELFVKAEDFERYVKYIHDNDFDSIFSNEIEKIGYYTKPVALNFDDAYVDFYTNAFPILEKYKVKSTLFVISGMVGNEGYCTWEQLEIMSKSPYVSIQSHTVTHSSLDTLNENKQKIELEESKKTLEEKLGITVDTICYPAGKYNDITIKLVKQIYKYGIANYYGIYNTTKQSKYEIPRVRISRSSNSSIFENACKLSIVEKEH